MILRSRTGFRLDTIDRLARSPTTYVYAVSNSQGAIKVGKTENHPVRRLRRMQTASPTKLVLVGWTQHLTEARAHKLLWRWHLEGGGREWFRCTPELLGRLQTFDWLDERVHGQLRSQLDAKGGWRAGSVAESDGRELFRGE